MWILLTEMSDFNDFEMKSKRFMQIEFRKH